MSTVLKKSGVFITGIDTDVGKTVITAGLLRSLLRLESTTAGEPGDSPGDSPERRTSGSNESETGQRPIAFKPIQTGCIRNADGTLNAPDADVYRKAVSDLATPRQVVAPVLFSFAMPCSPHLAAAHEGGIIDTAQIIQAVDTLRQDGLFPLVEGAGGIYVPINERHTMLDLMAGLGLPVLLVAANRLGVINHVLLSLNALRSRGLTVAGVIMNHPAPSARPALSARPAWPAEQVEPFEPVEPVEPAASAKPAGISENDALILDDNITTIHKLGAVRVFAEIPHLPRLSDSGGPPQAGDNTDGQKTSRHWNKLAQLLTPVATALVATTLAEKTAVDDQQAGKATRAMDKRLEDSSEKLLDFDREHIWHPYTSALSPLPVREAVRAEGCRIYLRDGAELIDGMASWWCAVHGYGHPRLVAAMRQQAADMPHVMFGGLTHKPAVALAQKLLSVLPAGLEHVFFADSGSVSVEVALKMALQYWQARDSRTKKQLFLTVRGGYHGDTIGAMSVCDPVNGMHTLFSGILPRQIFIERPACRFDQKFNPQAAAELEAVLHARHHEISALILEPIVQGAGGMWFYHPEYLRRARELCDQYGVLLILDEIATGFGRTGKLFASEWAGISPDIICLGKALTGGCLTLSATVASRRVARGISSDGGVFMHGPTFMANPLACAVAAESLDLLLESDWRGNIANLEKHLTAGLTPCKALPGVADVRILGGIGVVELKNPVDSVKIQSFFVKNGVWIRPFGRLVYLMPPYAVTENDVRTLTSAVARAVVEFC